MGNARVDSRPNETHTTNTEKHFSLGLAIVQQLEVFYIVASSYTLQQTFFSPIKKKVVPLHREIKE